MECLFVRHAQGEHILNPPDSLQLPNAGLTEVGRKQSLELKDKLSLTSRDFIVISPTRRTIETALIWSQGTGCKCIVHQAVGPRMFPLLPASQAWACDRPLPMSRIADHYALEVITTTFSDWEEGINAVSQEVFEQTAARFLEWCTSFGLSRIHILSHDGTITAYRQYLGENGVTRQDFLGETGSYLLQVRI